MTFNLSTSLVKIVGPNNFSTDEYLAKHSSWKIGGPADYFVTPAKVSQLARLRLLLHKKNVPNVIIGAGSNLLFDDEGYRGVVIKMGHNFSSFVVHDNTITADAGLFVPCLARIAKNHSLTGIEHIAGIPGSLGGLVFMNGGSNRQSIGTNIDSVRVMSHLGQIKEYNNSECMFAYRNSRFQKSDEIILTAQLILEKGTKNKIYQDMLKTLRDRREKFPLTQPNCGSVFVSAPEIFNSIGPPGKIIELAGLKGRIQGGAMVSPKHGNFIVNYDNASSRDILHIINDIIDVVYSKFSIKLKCEVKYVKPEGHICSVDGICEG